MKVMHIATAKSWRGGEQQVAYLIEELNELGIEQLLVCTKGSAMEKYCMENNLLHKALKKRSSFDPVCAFQIKKASASFQPSLIHLHDAHAHTFAVMAAVLFQNRFPLVLSRRVDFPVSKGPLSIFKYNHPLIRKIVCVSDEIKRITGRSIKDKSKLVTVYSGIDTGRFNSSDAKAGLHEQYNLELSVRLIGNTSAIADHKDYFTFIDTAKLLIDSTENIAFFIIGDGPDKNMISEYVKEKGLEANVIFTGFRNDIPAVLRELDVFLMTSKTEGLGTSLLDAMASGVPIVSTNAGGIPEIVKNNVTGLASEVGNSVALAENVKKILNDDELRKRLVSNASLQVEKFSKASTAKDTLNVYRELGAGRGLRNK